VQGIQGISRQTFEEFGLTCCFATKTAKRSGKKQGMPGLTVPLNPNEAGIDLINFPQNFFRKVFNQRSCAVSVAF